MGKSKNKENPPLERVLLNAEIALFYRLDPTLMGWVSSLVN